MKVQIAEPGQTILVTNGKHKGRTIKVSKSGAAKVTFWELFSPRYVNHGHYRVINEPEATAPPSGDQDKNNKKKPLSTSNNNGCTTGKGRVNPTNKPPKTGEPRIYVDADYAHDGDTQRSTEGTIDSPVDDLIFYDADDCLGETIHEGPTLIPRPQSYSDRLAEEIAYMIAARSRDEDDIADLIEDIAAKSFTMAKNLLTNRQRQHYRIIPDEE